MAFDLHVGGTVHGSVLTMLQKRLLKDQSGMSPSAYVSDASEWATTLVRVERERGNPDPISTVARHGRVSKASVWSLIYRPPKKVAADVYFALGQLYERECARQMEKYGAERARTEAKTRIGAAMVGAADRLSCSDLGSVDDN